MTAQDITDRDYQRVAQRWYEPVVSCSDYEERAGEGAALAGPLELLPGLGAFGDHGANAGWERSATGRRRGRGGG
jgi:hypothetical protein